MPVLRNPRSGQYAAGGHARGGGRGRARPAIQGLTSIDGSSAIGTVAPVLVFGWGNPARGDDALGPLLIEAVAALELPGVECLTDFQLQVEHALDLRGRKRVLFVDASYDASPPFLVSTLTARRDGSYTTHELSPEAVLHVFTDVVGKSPPPVQLLAIRGEVWGLGADPSEAGLAHLAQAVAWVRNWAAAG